MKIAHLIEDLKGAIFDMDGLLVNSESLYEKANIQAAKEAELDLPDDFYQNMTGSSVADMQKFFDEHFANQQEVDDFIKKTDDLVWQWANEGKLKLQSGVLETLTYFDEQNIKMCVASSNYQNFVERFLELTNIKQYFKFYLFYGAVSNPKPSPDVFNLAADKLGINKKNLLVFEDSATGVLAAKNADIKSVMVPDLNPPTKIDEENATLIVPSFADFIKKIK